MSETTLEHDLNQAILRLHKLRQGAQAFSNQRFQEFKGNPDERDAELSRIKDVFIEACRGITEKSADLADATRARFDLICTQLWEQRGPEIQLLNDAHSLTRDCTYGNHARQYVVMDKCKERIEQPIRTTPADPQHPVNFEEIVQNTRQTIEAAKAYMEAAVILIEAAIDYEAYLNLGKTLKTKMPVNEDKNYFYKANELVQFDDDGEVGRSIQQSLIDRCLELSTYIDGLERAVTKMREDGSVHLFAPR